MKSSLTPKQEIVLKAIRNCIAHSGEAPTLREIMEAVKPGLNVSSVNSIVQYVKVLEAKGHIQNFSKVRGVRLLEGKIGDFIPVPLLGNADCGEPLSYADDRAEDFINVSKKLLKGDPKEYFFVKAVGSSMDREGIQDSNFVLIRKSDSPEDGKNVLAVINGFGTIKKLRRSGSDIQLVPNSNDKRHRPIFLHSSDSVYICGVVEKIFN